MTETATQEAVRSDREQIAATWEQRTDAAAASMNRHATERAGATTGAAIRESFLLLGCGERRERITSTMRKWADTDSVIGARLHKWRVTYADEMQGLTDWVREVVLVEDAARTATQVTTRYRVLYAGMPDEGTGTDKFVPAAGGVL